jgi:DNA-binding LytR/AlgR family response regulator
MKEIPIRVLIIEDELPAAKRLKKILGEVNHFIEIVHHCESIFSTLDFLQSKTEIDLIFMDIRLGDGISFDLFNLASITAPVIFTTAFDEYLLKAFKVNSIDYLLKPIDPMELAAAIDKYKVHYSKDFTSVLDLSSLLNLIQTPQPKERFLIKNGTQMSIVPTSEIQYFFTEDGYSFLVTVQGKKHLIDFTLDQLQKEVNAKDFFRINRSMIVSVNAIKKVEQYFNSRFSLELSPVFHESVIVAREKVKDFKEWLES